MRESDKENAVQRGNFDPHTVFSKILAEELPAEFLYKDNLVTAFMDIQPITRGHALVIPNIPALGLSDLPPETGAQMFRIGQKIADAIKASDIPSEGINLFLADGVAAGQTVFHVHLHIFPRFEKDGFGWKLPDRYFTPPPREELREAKDAIVAAMSLNS
jgi:diadenosine tetraphosphate (Ap4A) HIT family hydrolase